MQFGVLGGVHDKPFDTNAILSSILTTCKVYNRRAEEQIMSSLDSTHPQTDPLAEVCSGQDNCRILSTELQSDGRKILSGSKSDLEYC